MNKKTLDSGRELAEAIRRRREEVARMTPEEQKMHTQKMKEFAEKYLRLTNDNLNDFEV